MTHTITTTTENLTVHSGPINYIIVGQGTSRALVDLVLLEHPMRTWASVVESTDGTTKRVRVWATS